mgnify:CR=1 FL=1
MKRTTVLVKQVRGDKAISLNRTVRIWINGVEVDGIVSYLIDDTVGTPAQRVTMEFYADVTVENAEGDGK